MLQTNLKVVAVGEPDLEALTDGKAREAVFDEASDNETSDGLYDQHCVAEGKEPIPLFHGFFIGAHDLLFSGEGTDQHDECALGKMKIGNQGVGGFEAIAGIDENTGLGVHRTDDAPIVRGTFQNAAGSRSDRNNSAACRATAVDLIGYFF